MRAAAMLLWLCAALALCAGPAAAQAGAREDAAGRWERKTPAERELLRRRFAELQRMSPEERRALQGLAERLKARESKIGEALPDPLRARLAELPPDARRGVVHEYFRDVLRREGEGVMGRLPQAVVRELEAVPPQRRPLRLERILRHDRPLGARDVRRLGEALGVAPERLADLEALPPAELAERALQLHREAIDRRVRELGPPPGLDDEAYAELAELPHREFFGRWRSLDPTETYGGRHGRGKGPEAGPPPGAEARAAARARADRFAEARRALAPTLEERLELAGDDADARLSTLRERGRRRCLTIVEEHRLLPPDELEALRARAGRDFEEQAHRALRRGMRDALGGPPRGRERPGPEPGPGGPRPGVERPGGDRRVER
jgi:hypothetical protein